MIPRTILTLYCPVLFVSGEAVSLATKTPKLDMKEFGRKVDLLFYEGNVELGNLEFKTEKIRHNEMRKQHSKNIRINRSIMESHFKACGQKTPMLFMDIQGI
jgi:hypothetical protein